LDVQFSLFGSEQEKSEDIVTKIYDRKLLMADLEAEVARCTRCRLHLTRINTVPGEGNIEAKLMFIGEGPGADEDAKGRPFVGAAGHLLDNIIAAMGMSREEVYIGNIVKCRPPANRLPEKDEVESCIGYLNRQIGILKPKVIVLLGSTAYKSIFPDTKDGITKARGKVLIHNEMTYIPTFHPAALLRDPSKKADVWVDMKKVLSLLREDS
jgi:uracil-DNA glycosylase family 4